MRHRPFRLPGPEGRRCDRDLRRAGDPPHLSRPRRHADGPVGRYPRTARVNQVLREVVADSLERAADADERLRMVTVTGVQVTPDLRQAKVFMSSISDDAGDALAEHRPELQRAIARQLRLKRTPQLSFSADPGVAHGQRVEEILRHLHDERPGGGGDEP